MQLIAPVWSIDRIARNVHKLRVLSIGPRSEIEIFSLLAMGFRLENITAIDLISYSPYVKIGDMHALPLPDNAFDVILLGWVLAYSKTPQVAANEVTRVAAQNCVVAVAGDYNNPKDAPDQARREGHNLQSSDDFLKLWQGHVGQVYVRQDCDYPNTALNMAVFEIKKSANPS